MKIEVGETYQLGFNGGVDIIEYYVDRIVRKVDGSIFILATYYTDLETGAKESEWEAKEFKERIEMARDSEDMNMVTI